jgi:hypothetical protein
MIVMEPVAASRTPVPVVADRVHNLEAVSGDKRSFCLLPGSTFQRFHLDAGGCSKRRKLKKAFNSGRAKKPG